ncbi:MAG: DegT/DnrJ/EryC1/StrS family aminotransferase, partial [Candidatus Binatia bacterium]
SSLNSSIWNSIKDLFSPRYRVPLAVPYWSGAVYRAILRSFFSCNIIDGRDLGDLKSVVDSELGVQDAILCGSGSLALEIALRACSVHKGDEVVIPTFCCTSVVSPIVALGAHPVLADVGDELNLTVKTVEAVLTGKTKAIIVPHLFGNPADINGIIGLVHGRGIYVVDDAAQALGATIGEDWLGSFGDAGVFSFGNDKVCSGLGGGVVISRQVKFRNGSIEIALAPALRSVVVRNFLEALIWRRWRRWTLPLQAALTRQSTPPDLPPAPYRRELMANLNAAVAVSLMQTLRDNIAARRARVHAYREMLGADQRLTLVPHRIGSACLTQVVRVVPQRRGDERSAALIEALRSAGYEVQGSYIPIHLLPHYQQLFKKPLRQSERVWSDLVELPCEPDVSFDEVARIVAVIKQVLDA